jgi:starch phosphorylase
MTTKHFKIEFQPTIPKSLLGLVELANDLYYSWNTETRMLFRRLDKDLWEKCNHNPKLFLRRIAQQKLDEASNENSFMEDYARVLSSYNAYRHLEMHEGFAKELDAEDDLIAYLCLEFGFHESMPIYSGGLGILAGDLCKAASDMAIPFVGVGLLYRQGYFTQEIDNYGNQIAHYYTTEFEHLPISPCKTSTGDDLQIKIDLPNRSIILKIWKAVAGNINLYFLDSDIAENAAADREITYQLYKGGSEIRILQEIVLGIGSVRALRALDLFPTIWHINEGHAAFSVLERCREDILKGMEFNSALELNSSNVVFTTHTPVPAGHDIFTKELVQSKFDQFVKELGIEFDAFMKLGNGSHIDTFNMTSLALHCSRFHNGVSKIHHNVASNMESHVWPDISPEENPIGYVTNGVHISTFLAKEWTNLFDMRFGEWRKEMNKPDFWKCLDEIPSHRFWSLRRELKSILLSEVHRRLAKQCIRNGRSESTIGRITHLIKQHDADVLVLGFARRFATYKRANLLFYDLERLSKLLNDPTRPTVIIFAGKAHPDDVPGRELVKMIHEYTQRPEFQGKILHIENYDMVLARRLVAGVDVWINTPEYPLEASGTSGQKAGMNGVLNLSILDGWWDEGYNGKNGWAITPHGAEFDPVYRNQQEANDLLEILENEVIPTYFDRNGQGYSAAWVGLAKESMKSIIPNFNAQRMLSDYMYNYYLPARDKSRLIKSNNGQNAAELSQWKSKIRKAWPGVSLSCVSDKPTTVKQGESFTIVIEAKLNGLSSGDVVVECVLSDEDTKGMFKQYNAYKLSADGTGESNKQIFSLELNPNLSGMQFMKIRMYPYHEYLCHPFEMGSMTWLQE